MPAVNITVIKNSIAKNDIRPVYFLFGNDAYLKKQYADKIIDKTASRDDVFNFMQFGGEARLSDIYDAVMQFPMLSDKKCVVLSDYDFEKADKSDFATLMEIIGETPDTTVFIIWCNNYDFDAKKSERAKKIIGAVEKIGGMAAQLDHLNSGELRKMLATGAAKRGINMPVFVAEKLIENCGEDIFTLKNELEKLCSYCLSNGLSEITAETVSLVTVRSFEASVFELSKKIFAKDTAGVIRLLDELFYLKSEPAVILHSIFTSFIDAYRVFTASCVGVATQTVADDFGYRGRAFVLNNIKGFAVRLDNKTYDLCFEEIKAAEELLKGYAADERTVIEQLCVRLIYIISKGTKIDEA